MNHDRLRSAFNMVATDRNTVPMVMGYEDASFVPVGAVRGCAR